MENWRQDGVCMYYLNCNPRGSLTSAFRRSAFHTIPPPNKSRTRIFHGHSTGCDIGEGCWLGCGNQVISLLRNRENQEIKKHFTIATEQVLVRNATARRTQIWERHLLLVRNELKNPKWCIIMARKPHISIKNLPMTKKNWQNAKGHFPYCGS